MKKPAKTDKPNLITHPVSKRKDAKQPLNSVNPLMSEVIEILQSGTVEGVSDILGKVRWMSRLQAKSFASFFGKSEYDQANTQYELTIKHRKKGRPPNDSVSPEQASYQRGQLVSEELKRLTAEAEEEDDYVPVTAKIAINSVVDRWPFLQPGKPHTHSSLAKDYSYFCKVKKLTNGNHSFPPFPKLVKEKKTK